MEPFSLADWLIDAVHKSTGWTLADLNSLVQPDELVGMEVYTPSMTPAEFRTKVGCGTIVVWTKAPEKIGRKR